MAKMTVRERLQPSLLDRLTDDHPERKQEGRDDRVISVQRLRKVVLRDLEWLLNTGSLEGVQDLDTYPHVAESVLNYGTPDLTGVNASTIVVSELGRRLRKAIQHFEPRIVRGSLNVTAVVEEAEMSRSALTFEIRGELWAYPMPLHMFLRTEIDLESGDVRVEERSRPGG